MAENILAEEESPDRFETLAIDLCNKEYGFRLLPTSKKYDRGRDGRGVAIRPDETHFLAVSLREDWDKKVGEDLTRLKATTKPKHLIYCSTFPLTEHAIDKIKGHIRTTLDTLETLEVFGRFQLGPIACKHSAILEAHYPGEIQALRNALLTQDQTDDAAERALRIALCTQLTDDAQSLRVEVWRGLILTALSESPSRSVNELLKPLQDALRLSRPPDFSTIEPILGELTASQLITKSNAHYAITSLGRDHLQSVQTEAAGRLLTGRRLVLEEIQRLSGRVLTESQCTLVWNSLQDKLAHLFYEHGLDISNSVLSMIEDKAVDAPTSSIRERIQRVGDGIASLFESADFGADIGHAVLDMFFQPDGPVLKWLSETCAIYLSLCSLGLDARGAETIKKHLSNLRLVVDSDIILSLLSTGESEHDSVVALFQSWRRIGGRLFVATPVLHEVAYHAHISEFDFNGVEHYLSKYSREDAQTLIVNAFVRGFWSDGGPHYGRKRWNHYISRVRGRSAEDYSVVAKLLFVEHQIEHMKEEPLSEPLAKDIKEHLVALRVPTGKRLEKPSEDKCTRDGQLLAIVAHARSGLARVGSPETYAVLTSSSHLRRTAKQFRARLGEGDAVISIQAAAYLVSLLPGTTFGLQGLRKLLFASEHPALRPILRLALRVVKASAQFHEPWSRRFALQRDLSSHITEIAKQQGRPQGELEDELSREPEKHVEHVTTVISAALDKQGLVSKAESENSELRRLLSLAQAENVELRRSRR